MTPYYEQDGITIFNARCEDALPTLASGSIDLIFTSPPYNLGVTSGGGFNRNMRNLEGGRKGSKWDAPALAFGYGAHDDAMPYLAYREWQRNVLRACWRTVADWGAIFYNHKPRVQNGLLQTPLDLNPNLPVRQIIIWARAGGINFSPTHYLPSHEWIVVFAQPRFELRDRAASGVGDVWYVPQEGNTPHPAPFPVALPLRALETTRGGPGSVLDPFMGSGTTLVAAKAMGRKAIGIEVERKYCDIAIGRLQQSVLPLEVSA